MSRKVIFSARFDCLPPRFTRQAGTRLCVVAGKPRTFKTAKVKAEEGNLLALLLSAKPENWVPIDKPVGVGIKMVWPFRKSEKRRVVRAGREIPLASRSVGDIDNQALKAPLDGCVAAQLLKDDSFVAEVRVVRCWGPTAYWTLSIWGLDEVPLLLDDGGGGDERAAPRSERTGRRPLDGNDFQKQPALQLRFRQGFGGGAE